MGVVGASQATGSLAREAEEVGEAIARAGGVLVCGGRGGVMEAACRGAQALGGLTVGLLPGEDRAAANEFLTIALPTGIGELRNGLIVRAADALVALGGGHGTLSEIALALAAGVPVLGVGTWAIDGVEPVDGPEAAVARALELARARA